MSKITVLGLGLMGAALARAMLHAGHDLTVWNRSPAKTQPFINEDVAGPRDVSAAILASPVILICIDDYAATNTLLQSEDVASQLAGRTIVQLSTGTPNEAREALEWMTARSVAYLDGAILCGPSQIATDNGLILLSGVEAANERAGRLLECLGGTVRYLGTNVGAASALDLAWLATCYGRIVSTVHAANLCQSESVDLDEFISLFPDDPAIQGYAKTIRDNSFDQCTATLQVWGAALQRVQQQGIDAGINTEIPDFFGSFFEKAVNAGHGAENVMALIKTLQGDGRN